MCGWKLVMTLMSCAVSDDVSDSHCTPDDGDGKEGRKEGRGKNGNPTIYVMRKIAASVLCREGRAGTAGRGRDLKIIRVSWRSFREKREFQRTCYRCCCLSVCQKCSMHQWWLSRIERTQTPLARGGDFASSRIFDAVRVCESVTNFDELPPI